MKERMLECSTKRIGSERQHSRRRTIKTFIGNPQPTTHNPQPTTLRESTGCHGSTSEWSESSESPCDSAHHERLAVLELDCSEDFGRRSLRTRPAVAR
eukprot:1189975-Prorocentrum_minimum.AAC.1